MKKTWSNAEVVELGVENTREDGLGDDAQTMTWYKCQYCGKKFWSKKEKDKHEETCFSRPAVPGGDLDGGFDIGVTPIS